MIDNNECQRTVCTAGKRGSQTPPSQWFDLIWSGVWVMMAAGLLAAIACASVSQAEDWPRWRGPLGNGVAVNQSPPLQWSDSESVVWRTPIPGRGHSSPIVIGSKILLTTADEATQIQSVLCLDRQSGTLLWQTQVNHGGFNPQIHKNNTHASPTVATDGERVFAVFNHHDAIHVVAVDLEGALLWNRRAGEFGPARYHFGFGASPIAVGSTVVVTGDTEKDPFMAAFDASSGREVWRVRRPSCTSYSTPVIATVAGREQLLLGGGESVRSYTPQGGREVWRAPASWDVSCGTVVWDDQHVFISGGFPTSQTLAVRADGSGQVVWQNSVKCYEQSLIAIDGFVYGHADSGVVYCWRAADGQEMWKGRLEGPVSASPVFANGHLYFTSERGNTFVVKADPTSFQLIAKNKLGDSAFASPAIVDHQLIFRVAIFEKDQRQEYVYCIGKP
ncbi:MAG TPA: PQQ-binding-like beta-propeller repeat protein [Pirellulaceae bacterium]|nr:PQQ-binding-like beta-propeller repeat protein [Pirellulaceae bacterium]